MSNILKSGEYLVKIITLEKGVSEVKGVVYYAIRFMNNKGYIDHRLYHNELTQKFAAKLFNAVDLKFNSKAAWAPQFEKLLNKYLIITVTEAQREKNGIQFKYSNVYDGFYYNLKKIHRFPNVI